MIPLLSFGFSIGFLILICAIGLHAGPIDNHLDPQIIREEIESIGDVQMIDLDSSFHQKQPPLFTRSEHRPCGYSTCSETNLFTYRRCCRAEVDACCWYFRMWVIVVFGIFALKLFLTIFVSFFRCVCC